MAKLLNLRIYVGILSTTFLTWPLLTRAEMHTESDPSIRCEQRLKEAKAKARDTITSLFSLYSILELDDGFLMRRRDGDVNTKTFEVILAPTEELWKMSDWQMNGQRFQLLDSGYARLAPESDLINYLLLDNARNLQGAHIRIRFTQQHNRNRQDLHRLRWNMHNAVLKKYSEMKHYLRNSDFMQLSLATGWSDNFDVFGLLSGDPKPANSMSVQEMYERLALTMQVTYHGRRNYFHPSVQGALEVSALHEVNGEDMLPYEFRLREDQRQQIVDKIYSRFDRRSSCEITRYALFSREVSRKVHDRFLLQVLERIESRGVKTILASTDRKTTRLFERYGFKVFMTIPTEQTDEPEFITYLEVGSEDFERLKARLKQSEADSP